MNRRLTIIAILAAAIAAISGIPAAAERSCGREVVQHQPVRVGIALGRVSCPVARAVIKRWLSPGHRKENGLHNGSFAEKSWTMSDGWTCFEGAGGGGCDFGGSGRLKTRKPRDSIYYSFVQPTESQTSCNRQVEYRPGLYSGITEYAGMSCTEARNIVLTRHNPNRPPVPGFECRNTHIEVAGGGEECVSGTRRVKWVNE